MKRLICDIANRSTDNHLGIGQYIAEKIGWKLYEQQRNEHRKIATLRGLYDQNAFGN